MSDLTFYRDRTQPLAERMNRAGIDNLASEEKDDLLQQFAEELEAIAKTARDAHTETETALEENCFDSEDLDFASGTLDDIAKSLSAPPQTVECAERPEHGSRPFDEPCAGCISDAENAGE